MAVFIELYNRSPKSLRRFIGSEDYAAILAELTKKFELDDDTMLNFLLQDLAVRAIEPGDPTVLVLEIQKQLELPPEPANQLAHLIWTRFKPLVDKLWKEAGEQQTIAESTPRAELTQLIEQIKRQEGPSRNVVDLTRVAKIKEPTPLTIRPPATITAIPIKAEGPAIIPDQPKPDSPLLARVIPIGANQMSGPAPTVAPISEIKPITSSPPLPVTPVPAPLKQVPLPSASPPATAPRPSSPPPSVTSAPRPITPTVPPATNLPRPDRPVAANSSAKEAAQAKPAVATPPKPAEPNPIVPKSPAVPVPTIIKPPDSQPAAPIKSSTPAVPAAPLTSPPPTAPAPAAAEKKFAPPSSSQPIRLDPSIKPSAQRPTTTTTPPKPKAPPPDVIDLSHL